MLRALSVHNLLLIDQIELEFQAGLNVLTGETGAGKSILLDSLGFVLGWRGQADLVRQGQNSGEVSASFELASEHRAVPILHELGLPINDELILRRINTRDGRKISFVNDRRCSGEVLRQLSDTLIELHGQHDERGLLNPGGHRALLDAVAGLDTGALNSAWQTLQTLQKQRDTAQAAHRANTKERDYITHALAELNELAPERGEEARLDSRRRLIQTSQKIRDDVAKAAHALGPEGADALLADAARWLSDAAAKSELPLGDAIDALSRSITELGEAQSALEKNLLDLDFDPHALEQLEERLFALRALARKHQIVADDLPQQAQAFAQQLASLDVSAEQLSQLDKDVSAAQQHYDKQAKAISDTRQIAAHKLQEAMALQLQPLKLGQARFMVEIKPTEAGAHGVDGVRFLVASNPGAAAGPIHKIASGGELSRFLLALKVCLSKRSDGLTLIFDEIDRGVGGATAAAVGARLSVISKTAQTLVVTHSPQVAAKGAHQWRVSKSIRDGQALSQVEKLDDAARVDEIARMLSGDSITQAARDAAQALLVQ